MSEAYARGGQEKTGLGGVIIVLVSLLAAIAVLAGLFYAKGIGERRKVLLAAGGCAPLASQPTGLECKSVQDVVDQYKNVTAPIFDQLNADATAYEAVQFRNLAAAKAVQNSAVASEKQLDTRLARFSFPPDAASLANALMQADEALVKLTAQQVQSSTLAGMRSFDARIAAGSVAVQADHERLLKALGAQPTANQEP